MNWYDIVQRYSYQFFMSEDNKQDGNIFNEMGQGDYFMEDDTIDDAYDDLDAQKK